MQGNLSWLLGLLLALSGMSLTSCEKDVTAPKTPPVGEGTAAPNFTLTDIEGESFSLSDYSGDVVIVDFWATWCSPCVNEIPHFTELYDEYREQGLAIIGLSMDDTVSTVRSFMQSTPINYRVAMSDTETYNKYQTYVPVNNQGYIPCTFVIDREGIVRHIIIGYQDKAAWEGFITPYL